MSHAALTEHAELCKADARLSDSFTRVRHAHIELEEQNELLRHQIEKLRRMLLGRRSEIYKGEVDNGQAHLFSEEEMVALEEKGVDASEYEPALPERTSARPRRERAPRALPAHLEVENREQPVPEDERICPCCNLPMNEIGVDEKKTLDYIPAKLKVINEIRRKYACKHCKGGGVVQAPPRVRPVQKGMAEPGLLAHIVVSKYADHLPLYRQAVMFRRQGIDFSASTLCDCVTDTADLFLPIVLCMRSVLLSEKYLQADETSLKVLAKEKCKTGFLWAMGVPRGMVIFVFRMTRARQGARDLLEGFEGIVQVDGYSGYVEVISVQGLTEIACMAHIRRYFFEALRTAKARAGGVLAIIGKLYAIETRARDEKLDFEARRELRQRESKPIFDELCRRCAQLGNESLPKSPLGEALQYFAGRREAMARYLEHGEVEIDNNLLENGMRGPAIGRKNYLFAGSEEAGHRAAVLYSIVESCKRLAIDPYTYIKDVLERISTHPTDRMAELTPAAWLRSRQGS